VTRRRRVRSFALAVLLLALVGAAVGLVVWRDRVYGEPAPGDTLLYVQSGRTLQRLSLSYSAALADVYWIRTVQYYGGTRLSRDPAKRYDLLYPFLEITTTLDPRFNIAYRFGSIFLAEPFPGGAGRTDQAVALLKKGFQANPDRWQYLQDIGFIYYWWQNDYRQAAMWFAKASEIPGTPWWLRSLAAVTATQGGDRRSSRMLWQSLRDTADNDWIRNNAVLRLGQLDALDAIDALTRVVRDYASRTGRVPDSWEPLIRLGVVRATPLDPAGVPFAIDAGSGAVTLSPQSPLNPLPVGAHADQPAR
jgi:tetratricopeptide (TPR) repeat protein